MSRFNCGPNVRLKTIDIIIIHFGFLTQQLVKIIVIVIFTITIIITFITSIIFHMRKQHNGTHFIWMMFLHLSHLVILLDVRTNGSYLSVHDLIVINFYVYLINC